MDSMTSYLSGVSCQPATSQFRAAASADAKMLAKG